MSERMPPSNADVPGFSDDPRKAMASLGIQLDESKAPDLSALDELKHQLQDDIQHTQGPFHEATAFHRYWPFALALVFGAFSWILLKPVGTDSLPRWLASLFAGLSGAVCLWATAMVPTRPGRAERVGTVGLFVGLIALCIEGALATDMPSAVTDLGGACAAVTAAVAIAPLVAALAGLKRARCPIRRRHAAALAVAGLAMASATVWLHCPAENAIHLFLSHLSFPLVLSIGLGVALFFFLAPKSEIRP